MIKIVCPIEHKQAQISNEEALIMFEHLSIKRFDDYSTTLSLIWLAKKLDVSDSDVHKLCSQSDKYHAQWVQKIIDTRRDECTHTISTLYYYLQQDVDKETLDRIFPKSKTYKEICEISKDKRTKDEQKYLDDISSKITQKNINILTKTEGFIERKTEQYVVTRDINRGKVVVIKAGLGKGKTTATMNHINNFEYDSIIVLTPRRSYAQSTISRINNEVSLPDDEKFVLYSDLKGSIKHKYIIIQVESLCRFIHEFEGSNTLVILDEVESLLYQMTSHKTHGKNHVQNLEMFEKMLKYSSKVLCMDAFISNRTIDVLKNINSKFDYYNYTRELEKRSAIQYKDKHILKNKLLKELELGKKV